MRTIRRHRSLVALGVLLLAAAAGVSAWLFFADPLSRQSTTETVASKTTLDGLDPRQLGIELTRLDSAVQPRVSREEAERVALENAPFDGVRDAVFAGVARFGPSCDGCNAWVLSLDVSDRPDHNFFVALVDAETGAYLGGLGSCNPGSCP